MRTLIKSLASLLAGCGLFVTTAQAQTSPASLNDALFRSVCERVQAPMVFSTRDTVFALSLPQDEPAEVYLQLTVGKNGKVKEKEIRVNANHIAGYVAPAFVAATKDLRIDKSLLGNLSGKDTSVLLTFPMEYQCVYDTIMKVWPDADDSYLNLPFYLSRHGKANYSSMNVHEREEKIDNRIASFSGRLDTEYYNSVPRRIWYYLAFIKDQPK